MPEKSLIHRARQTPAQLRFGLAALLIALVGSIILVWGHAAGSARSAEAETPHPGGNTQVYGADNASSGNYVQFGPAIPFGKASPGGTYADWYYPGTGLASIEWTEVPIQDPPASLTSDGLLHYYAYTFSTNNATSAVGFGYAGFQTNGLFNGSFRGKVINFSMWGNTGGNSPSPGLVNANNQESGGYQIMFPFVWTTGHSYRFQLKPGPSGTDSQGKWWGLWVTDQSTGNQNFIGEERVATSIDGKDSSLLTPHTGAFGEDLHWWRSLNGSTKYKCSDFQKSSMATRSVTANNGAVKPNSFKAFTNSWQPSSDPGNGYATTNCAVSVYTDSSNNLQMNLGYWSPAAPDSL
jgi:hypothetical protein